MPGLSLEYVSGLAEQKEEQEGTWVPGCVTDGHPGVLSVPTSSGRRKYLGSVGCSLPSVANSTPISHTCPTCPERKASTDERPTSLSPYEEKDPLLPLP